MLKLSNKDTRMASDFILVSLLLTFNILISHLVVVLLLLTLNMELPAGYRLVTLNMLLI